MSAITRWELGAYALSALLVLSSFFVLPVVRAVDPVLAVAFNYAQNSVMSFKSVRNAAGTDTGEIVRSPDPWGRPWRWSQEDYYSVGPDGIDSMGDGDDIPIVDAVGHPFRAVMPRFVLRGPRTALVVTGLALAFWSLVSRQTIRAARVRLLGELWRAAFVVALPAAGGFLWVFGGRSGLDERFAESGAGGCLQVRASIAIPLTWALLCYLPALAWRLSRPRAEALT